MTPTKLALRLAVKALQVLAVKSRCWTSRQIAIRALAAIAQIEWLDRDDNGLPEAVTLSPDEIPDDGNFLNMWS